MKLLVGGSLRTSTQPRSEHDMTSGSMLIQTRGGGGGGEGEGGGGGRGGGRGGGGGRGAEGKGLKTAVECFFSITHVQGGGGKEEEEALPHCGRRTDEEGGSAEK